jgi:hypothetical protein
VWSQIIQPQESLALYTLCMTWLGSAGTSSARIYRPSFRENRVYKFGHRNPYLHNVHLSRRIFYLGASVNTPLLFIYIEGPVESFPFDAQITVRYLEKKARVF